MSLAEHRASPEEQQRTADLLHLAPQEGGIALDVGAREGALSLLLAERFDKVIALDLNKPTLAHPKVHCVQGDAADLEFTDSSFDFVLCSEVLEHIPPRLLTSVCKELVRVCRSKILIGVPYRQDIRVGRTTCYQCKGQNPPWGHVNSFDESRLAGLFHDCKMEATSFVGSTKQQTNALSCFLMDLAGNPYGTYAQREPCRHCGSALVPPSNRNIAQKGLTKLAFWTRYPTQAAAKERAQWIHVLFSKKTGVSAIQADQSSRH